MSEYRHSRATRATLRAIAHAVCPPEAGELELLELIDAVLDEAELMMGSLPAPARRMLVLGIATYDAAAVVYPGSRGRRARNHSPEQARRYFASWKRSPIPVQSQFARGVRGILAMSYFELPATRAHLGYTPEAWIDRVTRLRAETYADDVRKHEATITRREPLIETIRVGKTAVSKKEAS